MPIARMSAEEAVGRRKANPHSRWGSRGGDNRVEPIASPHFQAGFRLKPGQKIFTVGSCFARNVEGELLRRGFEIPVHELFQRGEFAGLDIGVINNFGTPSIYNEIAWAFGEAEFDPAQHILEFRPGKFVDIHLPPGLRPEAWDIVEGRRRAIAQAYRLAAGCDAMIMTLGLVELWFDTLSGYYINVAPRPTFVERYPGRFELHVLSYEEALGFLEKAVLILHERAPSLRFLLTVSPVPLMATHRDMDVMVANAYSKSLLRVVVEVLVAKYDFVSYYPSYESVTLSDRKIAWMDDQVHVTGEIVSFNVNRMVDAYLGGGETQTIADAVSALDAAKQARARGVEDAAGFFERHGRWSLENEAFAVEHARHLLAAKRPQEALDLLGRFAAPGLDAAIAMARALIDSDRPRDALALLEPHIPQSRKSGALWSTLLAAAMALGDPETVDSILTGVEQSVPWRAAPHVFKVATWYAGRGDAQKAKALAASILESGRMGNRLALSLTDFFLAHHEPERAGAALDGVEFPSDDEKRRIADLRASLDAQRAVE